MGSQRRGFALRVHAVGWGWRAASLAALSRAVSAGSAAAGDALLHPAMLLLGEGLEETQSCWRRQEWGAEGRC